MRSKKLFCIPLMLLGLFLASCEIPFEQIQVAAAPAAEAAVVGTYEIVYNLDGGIDIDTGYTKIPSVKGIVGQGSVTMPLVAKADQAFFGWSLTGQNPAFDFNNITQTGTIELKPIYRDIRPLGDSSLPSYFDVNVNYEGAYTWYIYNYVDSIDNSSQPINYIYNSSAFPANLKALLLPATIQKIKAITGRNNFSTAGTNCKIIFHRTKAYNIRDNIVTVDTQMISQSGGVAQLIDPNKLLFKDSQVTGLY